MMKIGRLGYYDGREFLFDHRDPKTGEVWSDDIPIYGGESKKVIAYGKWVDPKKVIWKK